MLKFYGLLEIQLVVCERHHILYRSQCKNTVHSTSCLDEYDNGIFIEKMNFWGESNLFRTLIVTNNTNVAIGVNVLVLSYWINYLSISMKLI